MKSITYIGPHAEGVIIPSLGIRCAHGETIDVEDNAAAASLLEQKENWREASPSKPAKESKPNE